MAFVTIFATMKVAQKIEQQIEKMPAGDTFQYSQLNIEPEEYNTAAKALERLCKKGVIKKFSKGKFYKPKNTIFGELSPNEEQVLQTYLFDGKKRIAYITGTYLYNQMGLTTQIPRKIKIASQSKRIYVTAGAVTATPVKSYVEVEESNYKLLGILDSMKDLNNIPDLDKKTALKIFNENLRSLDKTQKESIVVIALKYPPRVRGLLGALIEYLELGIPLTKLRNSLNPLSSYDYIIAELLPNAKKWNIK